MARPDYKTLRAQLRIGEVEDELLTNADWCYHVYAQHMTAIAMRDAIALELEEATAFKANKLRKSADDSKRVTEKSIEQALQVDLELRRLRLELLDAKREADRWRALEKAFDKRSDALDALVRLRVREMQHLAREFGDRGGRNAMAAANYVAANQLRRQRRTESS